MNTILLVLSSSKRWAIIVVREVGNGRLQTLKPLLTFYSRRLFYGSPAVFLCTRIVLQILQQRIMQQLLGAFPASKTGKFIFLGFKDQLQEVLAGFPYLLNYLAISSSFPSA